METNSDKKPQQKICPRCGKTFDCLHAPGCWCFEYSLSANALEQLRLNYANCLCPECLTMFGEKISDRIR